MHYMHIAFLASLAIAASGRKIVTGQSGQMNPRRLEKNIKSRDDSIVDAAQLSRRAPGSLESERKVMKTLNDGEHTATITNKKLVLEEAVRRESTACHASREYIMHMGKMVDQQRYMYSLIDRKHAGWLAVDPRRLYMQSKAQMHVEAEAVAASRARIQEDLTVLRRLLPDLHASRYRRQAKSVAQAVDQVDATLRLQPHAGQLADSTLDNLRTALKLPPREHYPLTERLARDPAHWDFETAERRWLDAQSGKLYQTLGINKHGLIEAFAFNDMAHEQAHADHERQSMTPAPPNDRTPPKTR